MNSASTSSNYLYAYSCNPYTTRGNPSLGDNRNKGPSDPTLRLQNDNHGPNQDGSFDYEHSSEKDTEHETQFEVGRSGQSQSQTQAASDQSVGENNPFDDEIPSLLFWSSQQGWTLRNEFFHFNPITEFDSYIPKLTLNFTPHQWEILNRLSRQYGMKREDYIKHQAINILSPCSDTDNRELLSRLLYIKEKMEEFYCMLSYCSDELLHKIFRSQDIMHYWFKMFYDAFKQIDMIFKLAFLLGSDESEFL